MQYFHNTGTYMSLYDDESEKNHKGLICRMHILFQSGFSAGDGLIEKVRIEYMKRIYGSYHIK